MSEKLHNREIRVFISSTFRDMQYERDYLIKTIFPEIRQVCRERLVEFTEIDLRWGVTEEDAKQGKVVRICLEEIDRCHPYFLGFMGERYGWAPTEKDLNHFVELKELYPLVAPSLEASKSVTEMEILHGVLESPEMVDHAFFYLRDKMLTNQLADKSGAPSDYYDTDDKAQAKLLELKSRVRSSGFPFHENYRDLETMGKQVKADILTMLDKRYPQDKVPAPLEAERITHEAYAADRSQAYLPSSCDTDAMDAYIQSRSRDVSVPPLIIGGESGLGKSSLLSYWLQNNQKAHPNEFLIQHYVGVSGNATPASVLRRIMLEIKERNQEADEVPTKLEDIIEAFPSWLAKVRQNDPLLLAIDALNQIEGNNLNWLPDFIPPNVTLIVSALPGTHFDQLQQRGWQVHTVEPLDNKRRKTLIQNYLHKSYSKRLSETQISTIAAAPQCANPLFLITLLEELRVFGVFEKLDALIKDYLQAPDPAGLFAKVLQRMEADYRDKNDAPTIIPVVKAIFAARKGLTETELLGITRLNRQDLSIVLLAMDYHLSSKTELRNFFHDYLRQAVRARYLNSMKEQQAQHRLLAEYFDQQALDARKAGELPWQWQQADEPEQLKESVADILMFEAIYKINKYELLGYWLWLGEQYNAVEEYSAALRQWESHVAQDEPHLASILNDLGRFIAEECADYSVAEVFFRRALYIDQNVFGRASPDVAANLNNLAELMRMQGKFIEAEQLSRDARDIFLNVAVPDQLKIATTLNSLATALKDQKKYGEAERLYREVLAIRKKVLGLKSSAVAVSYINLANLLLDKDNPKLDESIQLYKSAKNIFSPEDLAVSNILNGQATSFAAHGEYLQAEQLYRDALKIRKNILGPTHPAVADIIQRLANSLYDQEKYVEAEKLSREALEIRKQRFGVDELTTLKSMEVVTQCLIEQADFDDQALAMYKELLDLRQRILGATNRDTLFTASELGQLYRLTGDLVQARNILNMVLTQSLVALGENDEITLFARKELALLNDGEVN